MAAVAVSSSHAQIYSVTNRNSVASVNVGSPDGMYSWTIDGVNQLYQQWFWFRVGPNNPEASINTISAASVTTGVNTLTTVYGNNSYSVSVDYMLNGGANGSGTSSLVESIRIHNYTQNDLEFHFFQYSDFNLGPNRNDDIAQLGRNLLGYFNEARQWNNGASLTERVTAGIVPGADHGELGVYPSTRNLLNDGFPTTLNDTVGALGPDDVTWAFQWDLTIAAGDESLISKTKTIQIPEPSALSVISLGCLLAFRRRR